MSSSMQAANGAGPGAPAGPASAGPAGEAAAGQPGEPPEEPGAAEAGAAGAATGAGSAQSGAMGPGEPDAAGPDAAAADQAESGAARTGGEPDGQAGADGAAGADGREYPPGFLDEEPDTSWFLPAGRAALAPEAVTVDDAKLDREPGARRAGAATRVAGAPPWAGESADAGAGVQAPPPWESGPWPGHGDQPAAAGEALAGGETTGQVPADRLAMAGGARPGAGPGIPAVPGWAANPLATCSLITGVLGVLVLPGIVLGVLGLRRAAATGAGRVASWLGIALSLLWAAGIVLIAVPGGSTPPDPGCTAYQAHGQADVTRAAAAIGAGRQSSALAGELHHAAVVINKEAARSQSLGVRDALSSLTDDLQSADDQAAGGGQVPSQVADQLTRDASAAASTCRAAG